MISEVSEHPDLLGVPETLGLVPFLEPVAFVVMPPAAVWVPPERLSRVAPMLSRKDEQRPTRNFFRPLALVVALMPFLLSGRTIPKDIVNVVPVNPSMVGEVLPDFQIPEVQVFPGTQIRVRLHGVAGGVSTVVHGTAEVSKGARHVPVQYETEVADWSSYFGTDTNGAKAILMMERGSVNHPDGLFQIIEPTRNWIAGNALTVPELKAIAKKIDPNFQDGAMTEKQLRDFVLANFSTSPDVQIAFGVKNLSDKTARFGPVLGLLAYNSPANAAKVLDQFDGNKNAANRFIEDLYLFLHGNRQRGGSGIISVDTRSFIEHDKVWGWPYIYMVVYATTEDHKGEIKQVCIPDGHYLFSLPINGEPDGDLSVADMIAYPRTMFGIGTEVASGTTPRGVLDYLDEITN